MDSIIKIKIDNDIKIPSTPNFIGVRFRTDSSEFKMVDIAEFTDQELSEIADKWKADLLDRASKRRSE